MNSPSAPARIFAKLPWSTVILICLTLGLAPFSPPHIYEKLVMLFQLKLVKAIDWFDLFLHGTPWLLLSLKSFYFFKEKKHS